MGYGGDFKMLTGATGLVPVTFTMMGNGDSAFNNEFRVYDSQTDLAANGVTGLLIDWFTGSTPIGTTATVLLPVGLEPFEFIAPNGSAFTIASNNGSDIIGLNSGNDRPTLTGGSRICATGAPCNTPSFGLFDVSQTALNQGTSFYLGFADGNVGNAGMDVDYQDMVIKETVPEPTTLALLGIGLAGLGYSRRKRKQ
jgi:hypothetical protein